MLSFRDFLFLTIGLFPSPLKIRGWRNAVENFRKYGIKLSSAGPIKEGKEFFQPKK